MKTRILGRDLRVPAIGLGIMGMDHAYGPQADRQQMIELIRHSVELGGNFFDTAPVYGPGNEKLLGAALKPIRNQAIIATKFGITGQKVIDGQPTNVLDSRPDSIRQQVEQSLSRLQTDHIDLLYQHRVDPNVAPETVAEVMNDLIKEGKILHWGVSNAPIAYIKRAHQVSPLTAMENQYSMVYRKPETELFALCEQLGIGFVAYSPLGNGFLSGKYQPGEKYAAGDFRNTMSRFKPEVMKQNQVVLDLLQQLAEQKHATSAQIVLAWEIAQKDYIVPIPGTTKMKRLAENLGASEVELSAEEMQQINHELDQMNINEAHF